MIPADFIHDLLQRVDIVEVISPHVELKRSGANWMGLCPFHAERSPSFSVTPGKSMYYCFGCGAGGDALKFLGEHLGLSFIDAVRDLAQRVGMAVPEEQVSPEERERRDTLRERRRSIAEVLEKAADFYRRSLRDSPRAVDYLKRRGLTGQIAARFGLGFAPPGWRALAGVFGRYDDPVLEEAGLVRVKAAAQDGQAEAADGAAEAAAAAPAADARQDGQRYDWFRERIMFPIRAVSGEVIGFGGRVLDDSKPKYMNSPETPVFSKGRELYGLYEARQALREKGYALVVEGYMDVVALAQHGFANAVATLGTACTADHVTKLFRFTDTVVFSFDGDAAGRRAAARALEAALPHATDLRAVKFLFLPTEHDPDSYVRELGAEAFERAVAGAVPLSRQLIAQAAEDDDLDTAEGRARLVARAQPLWTQLPEGALRDQVLGDVATQARLAPVDLARRWGVDRPQRPAAGEGERERGRRPRFTPTAATPRPRSTARRPQDQVARILLQRADWWDELGHDDHTLLAATEGWHAELFGWLERRLTEHGPESWTVLRDAMEGETFADTARTLVDGAEVPIEPVLEDLQRAVVQVRQAGTLAEAMKVLGRR